MIAAATEPLLGILKYVLLALLYLFFARVLWAVWSEVRGPRAGSAHRRSRSGHARRTRRAAPSRWREGTARQTRGARASGPARQLADRRHRTESDKGSVFAIGRRSPSVRRDSHDRDGRRFVRVALHAVCIARPARLDRGSRATNGTPQRKASRAPANSPRAPGQIGNRVRGRVVSDHVAFTDQPRSMGAATERRSGTHGERKPSSPSRWSSGR